jgi:hypothetical protein
VIREPAELDELVLRPLVNGEDIRGMFPGSFRSCSMVKEAQEVEERYYKLKAQAKTFRDG